VRRSNVVLNTIFGTDSLEQDYFDTLSVGWATGTTSCMRVKKKSYQQSPISSPLRGVGDTRSAVTEFSVCVTAVM